MTFPECDTPSPPTRYSNSERTVTPTPAEAEPTEAVTEHSPLLTPFTLPFWSTVATFGSEEDQTILPAGTSGVAVAVSFSVSPR